MIPDVLNTFIDGLIAGFGMVVIMTVFSILSFKIMKKWITKEVGDMWTNVKGNHVDMTGSIDFHQQHKEWNMQEDKRRKGGCL